MPIVERDLSFAAVANASPQTLTREQIEQYNVKGYVKPFDAFSDTEIAAERDYFDFLIAELKRHDPSRDHYALNCYHTLCEGIWSLATHPTILDHVEDIVGPNIVCWATHYFCKMPHDERAVPWHQDASYWPLTPSRTCTVWLALDDADEENSAMRFIPGTHDKGHLKWHKSEGPVVLDQEIDDTEKLIEEAGGVVYDTLKAGQFSMHADMLAHGSDPNRSDRRRLGLTLRYCPPVVRATDHDWAANAIICRGEDPEGYWKHHACPVGNDLEKPAFLKSKVVGGN